MFVGNERIQFRGLRPRQPVVRAIAVVEPCLHEGRSGVGQQDAHQVADDPGIRPIVDIEDRDIVGRGEPKAFAQQPRLVIRSIDAAVQNDPDAFCRPCGDALGGDAGCFVRACVVEDLDLQPVPRPIEAAGGVDRTTHHGGFVVDGQLNTDQGLPIRFTRQLGKLRPLACQPPIGRQDMHQNQIDIACSEYSDIGRECETDSSDHLTGFRRDLIQLNARGRCNRFAGSSLRRLLSAFARNCHARPTAP